MAQLLQSVTIDDPTRTHHCHPRSIFTSGSLDVIYSKGFGKCVMTLGWAQGYLTLFFFPAYSSGVLFLCSLFPSFFYFEYFENPLSIYLLVCQLRPWMYLYSCTLHTFHLTTIEKEEQIKAKLGRWEKIVQIRGEMNEAENRQKLEKTSKVKSRIFEKITKTDKHLEQE